MLNIFSSFQQRSGWTCRVCWLPSSCSPPPTAGWAPRSSSSSSPAWAAPSHRYGLLQYLQLSTISTIIYHIICVFCLALHPAAAAAPGQLDGRGGRHGLHVGDGVQVRTSDMFDLICPTCLILSVLHVWSYHRVPQLELPVHGGVRGRGVRPHARPAAAPRRRRHEPHQRQRRRRPQGLRQLSVRDPEQPGAEGGPGLRPQPQPAAAARHAHRHALAVPAAGHERRAGPRQPDQVPAAALRHWGDVQRYQVSCNPQTKT